MMKNKAKVVGDEKLSASIAALEHALSFEKEAKKDPFFFSGIVKSFEVCFEYAWKHFKREADGRGLEVYSPKDAIRVAGQLGLIEDVERWLGFLTDRNFAVHDYIGISNEEYLKTIKAFLVEVKKITS